MTQENASTASHFWASRIAGWLLVFSAVARVVFAVSSGDTYVGSALFASLLDFIIGAFLARGSPRLVPLAIARIVLGLAISLLKSYALSDLITAIYVLTTYVVLLVIITGRISRAIVFGLSFFYILLTISSSYIGGLAAENVRDQIELNQRRYEESQAINRPAASPIEPVVPVALPVEPLQAEAAAPATEGGSSYDEVVSVSVAGIFHGWDGESILTLSNGQIWQQAEKFTDNNIAASPAGHLLRTGKIYKLKLGGSSKAVRVKRIK